MQPSTEPRKDKRRRGPRVAALPDAKTGLIKRSFYIKPEDYKLFSDTYGGDISRLEPLMIAAWMALDGNVQDFVRMTKEEHSMEETVAILKEKMPEKMADMLLSQWIAELPTGRKSQLIQEARKKV